MAHSAVTGAVNRGAKAKREVAVYGTVRMVVWELGAGNRPQLPDPLVSAIRWRGKDLGQTVRRRAAMRQCLSRRSKRIENECNHPSCSRLDIDVPGLSILLQVHSREDLPTGS